MIFFILFRQFYSYELKFQCGGEWDGAQGDFDDEPEMNEMKNVFINKSRLGLEILSST